jgi:hypothetical protein
MPRRSHPAKDHPSAAVQNHAAGSRKALVQNGVQVLQFFDFIFKHLAGG